jgi:hypothetical protein
MTHPQKPAQLVDVNAKPLPVPRKPLSLKNVLSAPSLIAVNPDERSTDRIGTFSSPKVLHSPPSVSQRFETVNKSLPCSDEIRESCSSEYEADPNQGAECVKNRLQVLKQLSSQNIPSVQPSSASRKSHVMSTLLLEYSSLPKTGHTVDMESDSDGDASSAVAPRISETPTPRRPVQQCSQQTGKKSFI